MYKVKTYKSKDEIPQGYVVARESPTGIDAIPQADLHSKLGYHGLPATADAADAFNKSSYSLSTLGLSTEPQEGYVPVGVNTSGTPVYSKSFAADSTNIDVGRVQTDEIYKRLAPTNIFTEKEGANFTRIGQVAADPAFLNGLNQAKTGNDKTKFFELINSSVGKTATKDGLGTDLTTAELYDNWHNLSQGQKSHAISNVGLQGYTFDDGSTLENKKVTPDVGNITGMTAKDVIELQAQGKNPYPVINHWNDLVTLQKSMFGPRGYKDVANIAGLLGLVGEGTTGKTVNIDVAQLDKIQAQPSPQLGVGALSIPLQQPVPSGYVQIGAKDAEKYVIPKEHANTAITGTAATLENAVSIYNSWEPVKQYEAKGVVGGNKFLAGMMALTDTNPYAVGATIASKVDDKVSPKEAAKLASFNGMLKYTGNILVNGDAKKDAKLNVAANDVTETNYKDEFKKVRAEYAAKGVSSKQVGLHLINQAYADGRISEVDYATTYMTLHSVFDDNYGLYDRLMSGAQEGQKISRGEK